MSNVTRQKKAKSLKGERWKKIETPRPTLKMDYYVSNLGRLKSRSKTDRSEHILNPTPDAKDYLKSSIKLEGGSYGLYVHMAVAKYWSKKPRKAGYNRYIHKNLNRLNNKASNIVWVTDDEWREYVKKRAKKYGYKPHRKGGKPKLTEAQVIRIKKHLAVGRMPKSKIAAKFSVSHTQINRIEAGENWARLEVPGSEKKASKPAAKAKPAARKTAVKAKPAARKTAVKAKPAAKKTTTRAKKTTATAKKTTARKTSAAKAKPAARKTAVKARPAAKKTTTRAKKTTATVKKTTARKTSAAKAKPAARKTSVKAKPAARKTAVKAKPAAKKTTTRAKKTTATAKKTTARKTSAAKAKPAARKTAVKAKPAAKKTTTRAKKTTATAKKTTVRSRKKK